MRRLVWAFAGRTYHIVGNLMPRIKDQAVEQLKNEPWHVISNNAAFWSVDSVEPM